MPPNTVQLPLTQGYVALVDEDDLPLISRYKWSVVIAQGNVTCVQAHQPGTGKNSSPIHLHRLLLGFPESGIDHRNGDPLDNRKSNLRPANQALNNANRRKSKGCSSRFKGVCWHKKDKCWVAYITVNRVRTHLGSFRSEVDAALAYNDAAIEAWSEFARINPV